MKVKVGDVFMFSPEKMKKKDVKNVYDIENGERPCPVQYVYEVVEVEGGNEIVCQATKDTGMKVPANFHMFRDEMEDLVDEASGPLKNLVNKSKKRSKKSKRSRALVSTKSESRGRQGRQHWHQQVNRNCLAVAPGPEVQQIK